MKLPDNERLLRLSAYAALVALALMLWGLFDPTVVPVIVSMSVGQVVGTLSFGLYLIVLIRDVRRAGLLDEEPEPDDEDSSPEEAT